MCVRKEEGYSYAELVDRLNLMPEICDLLGLHPDALPDPTAFYHSLDQYAMYVWRALLRISAQQHPQSGHVALDSTFIERKQASQYYLQQSGRTVKTVKATALTDTESLAVLDPLLYRARTRHEGWSAGRPPERGRPAVSSC